jgi:hypothetical protein
MSRKEGRKEGKSPYNKGREQWKEEREERKKKKPYNKGREQWKEGMNKGRKEGIKRKGGRKEGTYAQNERRRRLDVRRNTRSSNLRDKTASANARTRSQYPFR